MNTQRFLIALAISTKSMPFNAWFSSNALRRSLESILHHQYLCTFVRERLDQYIVNLDQELRLIWYLLRRDDADTTYLDLPGQPAFQGLLRQYLGGSGEGVREWSEE